MNVCIPCVALPKVHDVRAAVLWPPKACLLPSPGKMPFAARMEWTFVSLHCHQRRLENPSAMVQ